MAGARTGVERWWGEEEEEAILGKVETEEEEVEEEVEGVITAEGEEITHVDVIMEVGEEGIVEVVEVVDVIVEVGEEEGWQHPCPCRRRSWPGEEEEEHQFRWENSARASCADHRRRASCIRS